MDAPRLTLLAAIAALSACGASPRSPFDERVMDRRLACTESEVPTQILMPPVDGTGPIDVLTDPAAFELDTTPETPEPGRPSDLMAKATKLLDDEDWREAVPVLQRVVRREGQDDAGNLELAQYDLGVAYYRSGLFKQALTMFEPLAKDRTHLMHHETLYWLVDLALEEDTNVQAIDLAYLYVGENYFDLDSTNRELEYMINFIWGRGFFRAGIYPEAIRKMDAVARDPRFARIANDCSSLAKQRWQPSAE
jgi:hypothetical protein